MQVRFWGTRGSLPVAQKAGAIQAKIARALVAAGGHVFVDEAEAGAFAQANLDFATYGAYGGATSCVEIEGADDAYIVCDMGSGLREFGIDAFRRCAAGHPTRDSRDRRSATGRRRRSCRLRHPRRVPGRRRRSTSPARPASRRGSATAGSMTVPPTPSARARATGTGATGLG